MFNIRRRNTFPRAREKHTCSFLLSKRRQQKAEKSEFFSFFFAPLFRCTARSSFSLFFSLFFSLSFLSQAACLCFFAREFSPHLKLFGGGSKLSNHHRNLSSLYKSKHNNTLFAFYVVNARKNKNRTHFKAGSFRELFDRRDDSFLY